jgi:hypothetical protein
MAAARPVVERILEINLAIREEAFAGLSTAARDSLIAALSSIKDNLMLQEERAHERSAAAPEFSSAPLSNRIAG